MPDFAAPALPDFAPLAVVPLVVPSVPYTEFEVVLSIVPLVALVPAPTPEVVPEVEPVELSMSWLVEPVPVVEPEVEPAEPDASVPGPLEELFMPGPLEPAPLTPDPDIPEPVVPVVPEVESVEPLIAPVDVPLVEPVTAEALSVAFGLVVS